MSLERPPLLSLSPRTIYLNQKAVETFKPFGQYIEFLVDPVNQKVKVIFHDKDGKLRYKLIPSPKILDFQTRNRLSRMGMKIGKYVYLGHNIFQHVDNIIL